MKKKSTSQSGFFNVRNLIAALFCFTGVMMGLLAMGAFSSAFAQTKGARNTQSVRKQDTPGSQSPDVVRMVGPVRLDQDLRTLPYVAPKPEFEERILTRYPHGTTQPGYVQSLVKNIFRPAPTMPPPLLTFEGGSAADSCGCAPPDSNGDVGPNHYIEAINVKFRIYDKSGNPLIPPTTYNSLFAPLTGTPCSGNNDGDPFVFYDHVADRWVLSDFAFTSFGGSPSYQCIAVSQTADPVAGGWFLYALQVDPTNADDYPKFGMWNNPQPGGAYHYTANLWANTTTFTGVKVIALDRGSMLSGGPANAIGFTISPGGLGDSYSLVAATFRTGTAPPAGEDEFLLAVDSPASNPTTLTQVKGWLFHVDFVNPANSTLGIGVNHTPNSLITVNPFVEAWTNSAGFSIVPQQGTSNHLDSLGDKLMTPVVYQNRSGTESLWAAQTTILNFPNGPTVIRWYQFNVTGGNFPASAAQQQDWSNANDGLWRFMPSIAVDQNGNMAIGYSTSSSTLFPGVRYAGRLAADPPNDLGQGEAHMFDGTGSETSPTRWGDYSMTTVDPADGISFWHVNEYELTSGSFNWHTRIGKFQFPVSCTPSWSAGPNLPTTLIRAVGVYFPADGNFYTVGGRTDDSAGSDFQHVLRYSPTSNTWTQMGVTLPDNFMNNMACGVLTVSGTPQIYCVGGNFATGTTATARVFSYNPATDTATTLTGDDWPGAMDTILPGGFAVTGNKLYVLGGFNINVASTNQIWSFDPTAGVGSKWVLAPVTTPEGIMYAPTCAIAGTIYVGGASDYSGGTVVDTTNSFSFNPATNTIGSIAPIPRATGETRALTFNGNMYVIGGGRVGPNPSNEVDVYNPATNTWATAPSFTNARRNFPTDTDGMNHIWLAGGYEPSTPAADMEIFQCSAAVTVTGAVSRKTHGAAGTFDIAMPLTGPSGVECRTTGGTNDYTLVVTFSTNVTVTGSPQAQVTSGTGCVGTAGACSGTVSVSGAVVTVPLTNIANAQVINVRINGVNGTTNFDIPMGFLIGDVTADRTVNAADIAQTKQRLGQAVNGTNFRSDVNANGGFKDTDVAIIKMNSGTFIP
jgi:N-acetylneuraminic acid mutarotase